MAITDGPKRRRDTLDRALVEQVAGLLAQARSALFITGAGLSADSGLPTYRGIGGLYDGHPTVEGYPIETVLSGQMMAKRPDVTWRYLLEIEAAARDARPNRGHEVIAKIEERLGRVVVFTQNVDGFHRAAGSKNVIAIHGDLYDLRCISCGWRQRVPNFAGLTAPPGCPSCGALVRPDVVLFGEPLPEAAFDRLEAEVARGFDIVFSIGTSSQFPYIARPVLLARSEGVPTIEINPDTTELSDVVDVRLQSGAKHALRAIWNVFKGHNAQATRLGR
ncbi:MAG TPA: NAD-dependent deacylase [Kofleriaceae bacterium]|nr:NAD-dependent deacylase [Kofleriaceae bacterium]